MSRQTILQSYELKADKHFLLPEITTIDQFVEHAQVAQNAPGRLYHPIASICDGEQVSPLYAQAYRPYGKAVAYRFRPGDIGQYDVFKGGYPDDLALLRATDNHGIGNIWISLISWSGFQQFLESVRCQ